jgi:hypothetical protein
MAVKAFRAKYDKTVESGFFGESWNDYSFSTYIKYLKELKNQSLEGIYSVLTGISKEMWLNPHNPKLYATIDHNLRFTKLEPTCEMPNYIDIDNGPLRKIEKDFMNLPLSKYQDMMLLISQLAQPATEEGEEAEIDEIEQIALMPKLIAVFVLKEYNDIDQIEALAKKIEKMPCDIVYTIGCFFLQKLTELRSGIEKKPKGKVSMMSTAKLVTVRLIAILVICIAFISQPKVIYSTLTSFLKKVWVRCTGGINYRIVSILPTKGIRTL